MKKRFTFMELKSLSLFVMLLVFNSFTTKAANVTISSAMTFAAADASDGTSDGVFNVSGDLTIAAGGSITCNAPGNNVSACPITIVVTGNMLIQAGGSIYAESHFSNGNGGNTSIIVGGTFTMEGPSGLDPGAIISTGSFNATSGDGNAGFIKINAGGAVDLMPGSTLTAFSFKFTGGTIEIKSDNAIDIDGNVLSQSTGTGAGNNHGHGGDISITTPKDLLVSDEGFISSKGRDPGADLIHLCGCNVTIYGYIESTGDGHATPSNPPNHLDNSFRPDKPHNSTAGIEVCATTLVIDALNHHGELNADLCCAGGTSGETWIDLIATGDITILNVIDTFFAVHANGKSGNGDNGGVITVKSTTGKITLTGDALQANGKVTSSGAVGGMLIIQAKQDVDISNCKLEARGSAGIGGKGGVITIRSFGNGVSGSIISDVVSSLNTGNPSPPTPGIDSFTACVPPTFAGTTSPSAVVVFTTACGDAPVLQPYTVFCCNSNFQCTPTSSTTNITACDSFTWNGVTFTQSGTFGVTFTKDDGCDSIAFLILHIVSNVVCNGNSIVVDVNTTINFNTNPPTYTGDPDLQPFFTYDNSGATPDTWFAKFDVGPYRLLITNGATITTTQVGSGNNKYAPGIQIFGTCSMQEDCGSHIIVESLNKKAGDIVIQIQGNISINGEIRNEVKGTNGLPGAILVGSKSGDMTVGVCGRIFDLGVDPGGNLISLLTCGTSCKPGDIVISGLVKAYAHAHADTLDATRPRIKVVSLNGGVTIIANTIEPLYDEFSLNGGKYDIYGGLLSWVRDNVKPGMVWVQALHNITVWGHGTDPTGPVRTSFGAIAAVATASDAPGGLVDIRSIGGNIYGYDRSFDVSGRNRLALGNYAHINLLSDSDIVINNTMTTGNPVVDASSPSVGDKGGRNDIYAYHGGVTVNTNAVVDASVPFGSGSVQGTNTITSCTLYSNFGTVTPAPTVAAANCIDDPTALFPNCTDLAGNPLAKKGSSGTKDITTLGSITKKEATSIYPNPATGSCKIVFGNDNESPVKVVLYNYLGQEMWSTVHTSNDSKTISLDLNNYAAGVYYVSFVQDGKTIETRKLVIYSVK